MSMALSGALQGAVYQALLGDAALTALVGTQVYDAPPSAGDTVPDGEYVTLGEEVVKPFDTATSRGARHDFAVTVHSSASGFAAAKQVAAAVSAALEDAALVITGGHLVRLAFRRAVAKKGAAPERRRIELRFLAVIEEV